MRRAESARSGREELAPNAVARRFWPGVTYPLSPSASRTQAPRRQVARAPSGSLPHLRAGNPEDHRVIGFYHDPGVDLGRGVRPPEVSAIASSTPGNGTKKPLPSRQPPSGTCGQTFSIIMTISPRISNVFRGSGVNRHTHALVGAAAANISHRSVYIGAGRLTVFASNTAAAMIMPL